jgi:hypothetical protein
MTKNNFAIATIFAVVATLSAHAANLRQDRILVEESIAHAQNLRYPGDGELRRAEDKLSIVQRDIFDLRPSFDKQRLERALDDALRALRDYRLPDYQKKDVVVRSGYEALSAIDQLSRETDTGARRELDQSLMRLDTVIRHTRILRFDYASSEVRTIQISLARFQRDLDIQGALGELDRMQRMLADRYLNPRFVQDEISRGSELVRTLVMQSRTYRDDRGDSDRDERDVLGRTNPFGSRMPTTEFIEVGRVDGRFAGLQFKARGANIRIDSIEVTFGNGRSEVFYGGFVNEGTDLRIDLRGQDRIVSRIRVTAQSMDMGGRRFGDAGHFVVRGLR